MQIGKVNIQNFKGIESGEIVPQKINLFIGKNGAGKTSYMEAIRYVLTGKCPDNPLRTGACKGSVSTNMFGTDIERIFAPKSTVRVAGTNSTQKSLKKFIEDNSGILMDTMDVITFGKIFASMNAGELSNFLVSSGLIPVEIDMDKFLTLCPLSEKARQELLIMLPASPIKFGMSAITDAYSYFYGARQDIKKQIDIANKQSIYSGEKPTASLGRIDKEISEINTRKEKADWIRQANATYQKAVEVRNRQIEQLKMLESKIKAADCKQPDAAQKNRIDQQIAEVEKGIRTKEATVQVLGANIAMFQTTLRNLDTTVCPLSAKLICSTDKTQAKAEITELLETNTKEQAELNDEITVLKASLAALQKQTQDYAEQMENYRNLQSLHEQYKVLKSNLQELPEKPKEIPSLQEDEERLKKLSSIREAIIQYNLAEKAKEKSIQLQKKLTVYEELLKALNTKGGISEKVIAYALEPLIAYCNTQAKQLKPGFTLAVRVENGVHILCRVSDESGYIAMNAISSGEQLLATYLIVDMLNSLSGFNILMLDDLDKLDANSLRAFIELLLQKDVLDKYDHIFLAAVNHPDAVEIFSEHFKDIQIICI